MNPAGIPIDSRASFHDALAQALSWATARRARRLWLADRDFAEWPLDDGPWLEALTAWLRLPQRRMTLLALRYDVLPRRHPRFVEWRRTWAHAVEAFAPAEPGIEVPSWLVDDGPVVLELRDAERFCGHAVCDARAARRIRDETDALLQRCEAGFAPTVLGL
jgi:hypothetical protein